MLGWPPHSISPIIAVKNSDPIRDFGSTRSRDKIRFPSMLNSDRNTNLATATEDPPAVVSFSIQVSLRIRQPSLDI
nr:hypothetical protein Itr_chr03CG15220 [Ipomoea trifida]